MESTRLIAVGIADADHDQAALLWTLDDARPGVDEVHLVHAYLPLRLEGCSWQPVVAARSARRSQASRIISAAQQRLRSVCPTLTVDGSVIAGLSWDVLQEMSRVVDLIVLGDDDPVAELATTASRVARLARCPVVTVPLDFHPSATADWPVTVLLRADEADEPLVARGLRHAQRRGTNLIVAQLWSAPGSGETPMPELLASRQEQLDTQIAAWCRRQPTVGVIGELLVDDGPAIVAELRQRSCLLVVDAGDPHITDKAALRFERRCPTETLPA